MADLTGLQTFANQGTKKLPMYDYLENLLKKNSQDGNPYRDQLLQTSVGAINNQYNKASTSLNQNLSAKGLGKSGIGIQAQANLSGQQSGALNQATAQVNEQDIAYRNQAIASLLGLNSSEGGYENSQNQQKLSALSDILRGQLSEDELNQKKDSANMGIWGDLIGAGGALLAAPMTGGTSVIGYGLSKLL